MSKGKSLLLGMVVGGVVGATATLLSAPSSGRDLRNRVKEQGFEWKELLGSIKHNSIRLKDQLAETSKEGALLIKELTHDMKESVEAWKKTVKPHQNNIYEYLEQIEASLRDLEEKVKNH